MLLKIVGRSAVCEKVSDTIKCAASVSCVLALAETSRAFLKNEGEPQSLTINRERTFPVFFSSQSGLHNVQGTLELLCYVITQNIQTR